MYRKNTQAFTLVELLTVMAIILVLAGLLVGVSGPASKSAKKRQAEVMVSAVGVAITMYHADTGVYPVTDSGAGCLNLYDRLTDTATYGASGTAPMTGWDGPYMEFKTKDIVSNEIVDPWSHAYNYETPGTHNTNSFDLWSLGPDGAGGNATDDVDNITNW